jgi:hypothetical protein
MTDDLRTTSRARIRRRTVLAAVLAVLVVAAAVTVSLRLRGPDNPAAHAPAEKPGITLRTDVPRTATQEEQAGRRARLQNQLVTAFERILPDGWEHSTFDFDCDDTHCWAEGDLVDSAGTVTVRAGAWADIWLPPCDRPHCHKELLADGTLASFSQYERKADPKMGTPPSRSVDVVGVHPDNTTMNLSADWPPTRTTPPLAADQWLRFANAVSY